MCFKFVSFGVMEKTVILTRISVNVQSRMLRFNKYDRTMGPGTGRSLNGCSFV